MDQPERAPWTGRTHGQDRPCAEEHARQGTFLLDRCGVAAIAGRNREARPTLIMRVVILTFDWLDYLHDGKKVLQPIYTIFT
jgi:hypothetical protein